MKQISQVILLLLSMSAFAQKETANWYFGNNAGIDFNSGAPVVVNNGAISTTEGCASMSDPLGNLLFYSEGLTIYNANHVPMPNGSGLFGGGSSSQSCIAFPSPAGNGLYYMFTVPDAAGAAGLCYNVIDMNLNGGLGDVVTKNVNVVPGPVAEKLTACKHANGIDFWVSVHGNANAVYHTVLVTAAGVQPALSQTIGAGLTGIWTGGMSFNGNGTKLAMSTYDMHTMELIDFDNATGVFSNPASYIFPNTYYPYSTEFSASGNFLYCCNVDYTPGEIYQFDMNSGSNVNICASGISIHTFTDIPGDIQLALDGKMYFARYATSWVGVINAPDSAGSFCNPVTNGVNVSPGGCTLGLPDFVTNFLSTSASVKNLCFGDSTEFTLGNPASVVVSSWDFDDPASGPNNTSFILDPKHMFTAPGNYNVQLILVYTNLSSDTITIPVTINPLPTPNLGPDSTLCIGQLYNLNPGAYNSYLWSNGNSANNITAAASGTYTVTVTDINGCKNVDSVALVFTACAQVIVNISSSDSLFCDKNCIDFFDQTLNSPYSWTWYFSGASPASSTDQNPTNICYNQYGKFDVILVACNSIGCDSVFFPGFITEFQLPTAPIATLVGVTLNSTQAFSYQWFIVGDTTVYSTAQSFQPIVNGNYYVLIADSNGCQVPSNVIAFTIGIGESLTDAGFILSPNPANDMIALTGPYMQNVTITVYDVAGKVIQSLSSINTNRISISTQTLATGCYHVQVIADNSVLWGRFVRE
ncbi:MAG: T9SS type A sorting domain-containing protein [Bacteroidetes bacterium]|nr:T9SS type A sorting domain-containing protein [Bacteroidota bacterium]